MSVWHRVESPGLQRQVMRHPAARVPSRGVPLVLGRAWKLAVQVLLLICGTQAFAAEPPVDPRELPRIPPTPLAQALGTFEIKKGFHLELVAHEPQVVDPVTVAFDENGRMFAVEMRDYSERRDENPHLGTIRLLEDADGDGHYEKSTVFADNLPWPTAVICWDGGIFVGASPDIFWFKDTNGDGRADERKVVFTGFGAGRDRLNMQALLNNFTWGPDNRIHGSTAGNGGTVTSPVNPSMKPLNLNGRDFSFDPRALEMRAEGPTAQYGIGFDTRGRKFLCSNSRHLIAEMYPPRYAGLNPHYNLPPPLADIAVDGAAAEVFRLSPDEPWRIIRTRWRIAGVVRGAVEGGGRVSGYFTGATGLTIYRGHAYGPEFVNNAFIGDAGGNLVHRKLVKEDGVNLVAQRPGDEQQAEFLASRDNWFRPVHFANAPDGCLYVIDMHRETIEHPWSIPESIKQHLDLNSGNDRGRVYRIAPDGFQQPALPKLGKAATAELVATLSHPNGWHRDTAARLLCERLDQAAVAELEKLLTDPGRSPGHTPALSVLASLGALKPTHLVTGMRSEDAAARQRAVMLAEQQFEGGVSQPEAHHLAAEVARLAGNPDPFVRYQVALSSAVIPMADKPALLESLLQSDGRSRWMQAAVLNAAGDASGELFTRLLPKAGASKSVDAALLESLAGLGGARADAGEAKLFIGGITGVDDPTLGFRLARAYGEGLRRSRSSLDKVDGEGKLKSLFARAEAVALDGAAAPAARVEALQLLVLTGGAQVRLALLRLLDDPRAGAVQAAALTALGRFTDDSVADDILSLWTKLAANLHDDALRLLLARPERIRALLDAVEHGKFNGDLLSASQTAQLRGQRDAAIAARAAKLFPDPAKSREKALADFQPALQLPGDAAKGKLVYQTRCAPCHRAGDEGYPVGPDLMTMKTMGREKLLESILDPNREVAPQFVAFDVEKKDGETVLGIITSESGETVTLRMPSGLETTLRRSEIRGMRSGGQSMMPDGMEAGLLPPDMADLLTFIESQ
jgi:putative membrane-bound dehydrogenase-like protein